MTPIVTYFFNRVESFFQPKAPAADTPMVNQQDPSPKEIKTVLEEAQQTLNKCEATLRSCTLDSETKKEEIQRLLKEIHDLRKLIVELQKRLSNENC